MSKGIFYDEIKFYRVSRAIVASNRVSRRVIMSFPFKHKTLDAFFPNTAYFWLFTVKMYVFFVQKNMESFLQTTKLCIS